MAEENEVADEELTRKNDENDEDTVKERINNEDRKRQQRKRPNYPLCRARFDVLSTPNRRLILDLYQRHAYHLSREKVENIKVLLQELYAMTPEETKKYFVELEQENSRKRRRKRLRELLRKQFLKQKRQQDTVKAYKVLANVLRKGIIFANTHSVPPLVSVRLRNLSDIVLEQICDLRNVTKPNRDEPDKEGSFLIAVADWMAVGIEQVYYDVQLKKNDELEKLEKEKKSGDTRASVGTTPRKTEDSNRRDKKQVENQRTD